MKLLLLIIILVILEIILNKKNESFYSLDNVLLPTSPTNLVNTFEALDPESIRNSIAVYEPQLQQKALKDYKEYKIQLRDLQEKKTDDLNKLKLIENSYNNAKKKLEKLYFNINKPNTNFFLDKKNLINRLNDHLSEDKFDIAVNTRPYLRFKNKDEDDFTIELSKIDFTDEDKSNELFLIHKDDEIIKFNNNSPETISSITRTRLYHSSNHNFSF